MAFINTRAAVQQVVTNALLNSSVNESATSTVAMTLDKNLEIYKAYKRIIVQQNKGFMGTKITEEINVAEQTKKMEKVEKLIEDVESGGPLGIFHLGAVSDAIERPIEMFNETGALMFLIGDSKRGNPAKLEYHKPQGGKKIGHYSLLGNVEPDTRNDEKNMCLFNVLWALTGKDPSTLKTLTLNIMKNNKIHLVNQIDDVNYLEEHSKLGLAVGGAAYTSRFPDDAIQILRNSTGTIAFKMRNPGHPHNHAPFRGKTDQKLQAISEVLKKPIIAYDANGAAVYEKGSLFQSQTINLDYHKDLGDTSSEWFTSSGGTQIRYRVYEPNNKNLYEIIGGQADFNADQLYSATMEKVDAIHIRPEIYCVENASIYQDKTAFISEADMAFVCHHVLKLQITQKEIDKLNSIASNKDLRWDSYRRALHIDVNNLQLNLEKKRVIYGQKWVSGSPSGTHAQAKKIVIVLQHHDKQENNPEAPVHIQTIYPIL